MFCVCHLQKACQRAIKCFLLYLKCFIYDFLAQIISYKIWLLCFFITFARNLMINF